MIKIIKTVISILYISLGLSSIMPVEFEYNQSTEQAFYFIVDANIDGVPIEEGDWIAAFRGDLCVGAREWIGSYTDIPVMGDDEEEYSEGYMLPGEYPTFKIYKLSEQNIYNAQPSQNVEFPQGSIGSVIIQSLAVIYDCAEVLGGLSVIDQCGVCDNDFTNDCVQDCNWEWGGSLVEDECGVCGGDNSSCNGCMDEDAWNYCSECLVSTESCIFTPDEFHFSQSTSQAFYFVIEANIS